MNNKPHVLTVVIALLIAELLVVGVNIWAKNNSFNPVLNHSEIKR
jgi:hypothetical protein